MLAGARVDADESPLIIQQQRLVAGVELDRPELFRIDAACVHERDRPVDLARQPLIALPGRAGRHEILVPGVHLPQIRIPAAGERAAQVQRHRRAVIGLQQPPRVEGSRRRGELQPVNRVSAVDRKLHAVPDLGRGRPGLGELPSHPADLHHRHAGRVGERPRPSAAACAACPGFRRPSYRRMSPRSHRPAAGTPLLVLPRPAAP